MQAILKNKHKKFCDWLEDVKVKLKINDRKLNDLEDRLRDLYAVYLKKREELKYVIDEYEGKQIDIRNRIKLLQRKGFQADSGPLSEMMPSEIVEKELQ